MSDLLSLRLAAQAGVLTASDALECGVTRAGLTRLVAAGRLVRIRTGVYVERSRFESGSRDERRALVALAVARQLGDGFAASHSSALALQGLPVLPGTEPLTAHVSRTRAGKHRPVAGVSVHTFVPPGLLERRSGVLCVRPAAAVLQWAAWAGLEAGVVAADAALHRRLATRAELVEASKVLPLGRGRGWAARVPELVDGRSESVGESRTRVLLHALGLPAPELQVELYDARGLVGIVDFLLRGQRTVVEFDGKLKYAGADGAQALVKEKLREDRLRALGFEVVRLTWRDLDDPALVLHLVQSAFERARRTA